MLGLRFVAISLLLAATAACSGGEDTPTAGAGSGCAALNAAVPAAVGPLCLDRVEDASSWAAVSHEDGGGRLGKFFIPAVDGATLPPAFLTTAAFTTLTAPGGAYAGEPWHEAFATIAAPGANVQSRYTGPAREAFAGDLVEVEQPGIGRVFVYTLVDPSSVSCAQHERLAGQLAQRFKVGPLYFRVGGGIDVPEGCAVPTLFVRESSVTYEVYTQATAYGVVRVYGKTELPLALEQLDFGWQNIVVLEETPFDIETIIAGAVTATRQGQLSHLNVRSAARGTPNCFAKNAHHMLRQWDGQLVRLTCGPTALEILPAQLDEAQTWRNGFRPAPQALPPPDRATTAMPDLLAVPTQTPAERAAAVATYGAKATNLAIIYQRIAPELRLDGFVIPMAAYEAHLRGAHTNLTIGSSAYEGDIASVIGQMLLDPGFRADVRLRRDALAAVRAAIAAASCPVDWLTSIGARLEARNKGKTSMWRFRSSSNAEDVIGFSGAGLYASQAGCLADDLDADRAGPSRCDPGKRDEHEVCAALKAVWASVWNLRAFEERDFAGLPHDSVSMGVLVNERSKGEQADMVVFSGDPNLKRDNRYLIDAQINGLEVVAPDPGTWPETSRLTLQNGQVVTIERLRSSSARPAGVPVVNDARLKALGAAFAQILAVLPNDDVAPPGREILYDSEWKVLKDGRLIIKQIRPFLR